MLTIYEDTIKKLISINKFNTKAVKIKKGIYYRPIQIKDKKIGYVLESLLYLGNIVLAKSEEVYDTLDLAKKHQKDISRTIFLEKIQDFCQKS